MSLAQSFKSIFVGKGSYTDMGDRYPVLDRNHQSNIKGMYVVGDISGTPDIKAAINSGFDLATHLASLSRPAVGPADCEVLIIGGGPAGVTIAIELQKRGIPYLHPGAQAAVQLDCNIGQLPQIVPRRDRIK